jgi:hypothetical protein
MTARKQTTAPTPKAEQKTDDYKTKAIVAAILITKGTPMRSALENADWIVESIKNESFRTK